MNREFDDLTPERQAAAKRVIRLAFAKPGQHTETLPDRSEAYAHRGVSGVHWGVNRASDGLNDKRGVWPKDQPV